MNLLESTRNKCIDEEVIAILHLNARLQPIHRGEIFEDGIDEVLKKYEVGEVIGGGTLQVANGEIDSCNIEMRVKQGSIDKVIRFIKNIGIVPKGSYIEIDSEKIQVGVSEGLGLYLNGRDLPEEVYRSCDINYLIDKLEELLEGSGEKLSHWEGNTETAIYFYGTDFKVMKDKIMYFIMSYPLCEKCRIIQIA